MNHELPANHCESGLTTVDREESGHVDGGAAFPLPPYIPGPCFPPRPTLEYQKA